MKLNSSIARKLRSIRIKLFLTLCVVVIIIILFLVTLNNFVLESFYVYSKQKSLISAYNSINTYYNENNTDIDIELELRKIAFQNNIEITIVNTDNATIYTTSRDFLFNTSELMSLIQGVESVNDDNASIIFQNGNIKIIRGVDNKTTLNFITLSGQIDNGYILFMRLPFASIIESVKISNNFLYLIGGLTILIAGIIISFISRRFTKPIVELNDIAKKMAELNFTKRYCTDTVGDEINDLGRSINIMSDKLENTIKKLKATNIELEKDIEQKSQIDIMRKQFISDVSHELKTPIALIQGYAEGLVENVAADEESRKFYCEVILDEANKMDKLVKELLQLSKLEYGAREFNNKNLDIVELIKEVIRKNTGVSDQKNIDIRFETKNPILVYADEFYIDQVITNYFTNAMKNLEEINNEKYIKIDIEVKENKVRISIFNTGRNIEEEEMNRIWTRFYKVDSSRNRESGGTGIGLSIIKAIMSQYSNDYGVVNLESGVEAYFELDRIKE